MLKELVFADYRQAAEFVAFYLTHEEVFPTEYSVPVPWLHVDGCCVLVRINCHYVDTVLRFVSEIR